MMQMDAPSEKRLATRGTWTLLGATILFAMLAFIPVADCPACVDGIGCEVGGWVQVSPCRFCGAYQRKVPLLARWVHVYRSTR